jgi:hypothetical protein
MCFGKSRPGSAKGSVRHFAEGNRWLREATEEKDTRDEAPKDASQAAYHNYFRARLSQDPVQAMVCLGEAAEPQDALALEALGEMDAGGVPSRGAAEAGETKAVYNLFQVLCWPGRV